MKQIPAFLYRAGLTRACGICVLLYFFACLYITHLLPVGATVFHRPIFNPALLVGTLISTYIFIAWNAYLKKPFLTPYLWSLGTALFFYATLSVFCYVKSTIPFLVPYYLDPTLQQLDIFLHFGRTPFQWLMPYFTPKMVSLLDQIYGDGWFLVMDVYVFWQLFSTRVRRGRIQFLSTFLMAWIVIGNGLATLLSSVGPTYYGLFYHDQFTAMNDLIVQKIYTVHHLFPLADAVGNRELLLGWFQDKMPTHMNGISSMPSLHTAIVFLMVLHSAKYAKPLLWLTIPLMVLIFIGSFMLGWHYAVDTYVSVIAVWVLWWINGRELHTISQDGATHHWVTL